MFSKRSGILVLAVVMALSMVFSGCGKKAEPPAKPAVPQVITYNLSTEPETLDPAASTGKTEATVQMALFEGLTRLDKDNQVIPGIAEKWDISEDGLKYTFYLRDAKWTNGDAVTAYDFEYAWKRLLDPEMANEYAYQAWYIKGAEEYSNGEGKIEDVAIRALDAKTFEFELHTKTPYFLSLTAFPNLYPVNKAVAEANKDWHTAVETFVSNGPFKMTSWEHNQKIVLSKNESYWAADSVKLETINMVMIESADTELTMFDTDQIDIAETTPTVETARLIAEGKATVYDDLATYYYMFNVNKKPFDDVRVRRALTLAIDRQSIIDNVTQAGQKPALAFVPGGIPDAEPGKEYREVGGDLFKEDVAEAKRLLAEAGYPDGKNFPAVELLYNTSEGHKKIAEAIQEMWNTNLGIQVTLTNQEWGVYLQTRKAGDYQVARAGWGADYIDAMTFMDMWVTGGGNNQTNWGNAEYDRLIDVAKKNSDNAVRQQAMHDAEKILMEEMPILPIYFYTNVNMYKPWVKDVVVPIIGGYQEFRWAYVEK